MKKTFVIAALAAFAIGASSLSHADVTPTDVKEGAHEKGETIKKNTEQAGDKAAAGARHTKDAGNRGAHKLRHKKDKAKEEWKNDHPDKAKEAAEANTATDK